MTARLNIAQHYNTQVAAVVVVVVAVAEILHKMNMNFVEMLGGLRLNATYQRMFLQ